MNTRFPSSNNDRLQSGRSTITNMPADAGFIPKTMMKKITLLFVVMLFSISGLLAQLPGGPVTTAGTQVVPIGTPTVTVPITVSSFNNIGAINLTIGFDPAVLQYVSGSAVFNPAFASPYPMPSIGFNNTNGTITIGWYDPSMINLVNGSTLVSLTFNYNGGSSLITFPDPTGIECEYTDGASNVYTGDVYNNGYVTDLTASATYTNICAPGNVGAIQVTASGGTGVYEYSIDNGATWTGNAVPPYSPFTFSNLVPGVYQVMVRDMASSLPLITLPVNTLTPPVLNVTQSTYHCFIQDAVDNAMNGDQIQVVILPWTFYENVTINKSVSINGNPSNPGQAIIDGSLSGTVVSITANNVTLTGFTVTNSGAGAAGVQLSNVSDATTQNNVITANNNGFLINGSFNTGNTIAQNTIAGNTMGMVLNLTNPLEKVNVPLNYWGDATGPFNAIHNSCGLGNGVSDKVIFHPWYTDNTYTTTATLPFYNVTMDTYYCTLQDAADHAQNNDVIHALYAGTYAGFNYYHAKNISVLNVSSGTVTLTGAASSLIVTAGHVSLNGFDFTTTGDVPTIDLFAGKLSLRNSNVFESPSFTQTGVLITGGELDAGTSVLDFGHNRFLVSGAGIAMNNIGGIANAICNHWGSILYAQILPVVTGTINLDPWSDYGFTMCDVLTLKNGPVTYAPKVVTVPGPVVLPITVDGFKNVDAISLTLNYDPAIIQFTGFAANSVFTGMTVNVPTPGTAIIGWFSPTMVPFLADGSLIVNLNFDFLGGTSLLEWNDLLAVNCEYQNAYVQYPYIDVPQATFYHDGWITDLAAGPATFTNVICKGTASGTITINNPTGGSGAYEFSVDNGSTWQASNLFNLPLGTYYPWIRDAAFPHIKLQVLPNTITIIEPALPLTSAANWTKRVRCKGESNGEALVIPNGGWGGYTYLWSDPLVQKTPAADSLAAGFYTVTVTDAGGCSVTASTFVIEPTNAFSASVNSTVVSCKGGSNGTITVNAQHGWGYYMYSINNITYYNYLTSNTITGLPAGNYTLHIFDDERCELYLPVTINEPAVALTASAVETLPVSCYGLSNGAILVTPAGGWGTYEISFDGVNYTPYTTGVYTGLAAGTYTIYVRDLHGCVINTTVTVTQPAPFTASISGDNTLCYGDASMVSINIVGGNAPFDILVTDGTNNVTQTGFTGNLFTFTQNYTATTTWIWGVITDANNCPAVTSGSATIIVNPLPEVGFTFKSLAATGSVFEYCYNESVDVSLSHIWAGTAPFNIAWTVNSTPYSATGVNLNDVLFSGQLTPGTYVVQITSIVDANGCTPTSLAAYTATVIVRDEPMISFGFNGIEAPHNASFSYCYDVPVGVTLYGNYGGTAPYSVTYEVNGVTTTVNNLNVGDVIAASQLYTPGTYNIVVTDITDFYGCKASPSFLSVAKATLTIFEEPIISFGFNGVEAGHNATFEYCYDQPVAVTLHTIYGGLAPYTVTYEVDGVTSTVPGLTAGSTISPSQIYLPGTYQIVVTSITDANGCAASAAFLALCKATIIVHPEPAVGFSFNNQLATTGAEFEYCYNEVVEVKLSNIWYGTAPFLIEWTVDGVPATSTVTNLNDVLFSSTLPAGVYTVQITNIVDDNGCSPSDYTPYFAEVIIHAEPAVGFSFNGQLAATNSVFTYCYNETVTVTLSDIWSGTAPFEIHWTVDGVPASSTVTNLNDVLFSSTMSAGTYVVQITAITDAEGCSPASYAPYVATVVINPEPAVGFSFNNNLAVTGSTFTYCYNETVEVTLSQIWSGTAPFAIEWTVDGIPATSTVTNLNDVLFSSTLAAGTYVVQITSIVDANGCSPATYAPYMATVVVNPEPAIGFSFDGNLAATGSTFTYCFADPVTVTLSHIWFGTAPFDVTWTVDNGTGPVSGSANGVGLNDVLFTGNYAPGTYTVQITSITDAKGCKPSTYLPYTATVVVQGAPVSGYFTYHNALETPLNNVTVTLKQGTNTIATAVTDVNGFYNFPAVCPGSYEVVATTVKAVGGINATDAVQVNNWALLPTTIEKVAFKSGDVNLDDILNAGDAGEILDYFVGIINTFTNPWVFWTAFDQISANGFLDGSLPVITVGTTAMVQNFYGMVSGDFNRSFVPGNAKSGSSVSLTNHGAIVAKAGDELVIPMTTSGNLDYTALSFILQYPADKVEILGIETANDLAPVVFNADQGIVKIGHMSLQPIHVSANNAVLNVRVRLLPAFVQGETVSFQISGSDLNEVAGSDYNPMSNVTLNLMTIEGTVGIGTSPDLTIGTLTGYPNPFNGVTKIAYTLTTNAEVTLTVNDLTGRLLLTNVMGSQSSGVNEWVLDGSGFAPGVYFVTLRVANNAGVTTKTIRIVQN
jgi:hypothetical protein